MAVQKTAKSAGEAQDAEATKKERLEHLCWAIESRTKNQRSALRLLRLFETYSNKWQARRYSQEAQDLLAVSFSLWRAAFLADKNGKRSEVFAHAKSFLDTLIGDNAISYPLDRKSKEWTFNFYTRNARYALEHLFELRPDLVPEYLVVSKRTPTERWEYCQELLDKTLTNFEKAMADEVVQAAQREQKKIAKVGAKQKRKNVRLLTEPDRKIRSDNAKK